ncbi:hypothetical protein ACFLXQ_07450 [Chloroflexota bacterium]
MSNSPQDIIKQQILKTEIIIFESFSKERRLDLIELARTMDYFFVGRNFYSEWAKSKEVEAQSYLIAYGLHKVLSLSLDESNKLEGAPLFCSTPESQKWANSVFSLCGKLGYCEHLLELQRVGLIEITKTAPNKYHARPLTKPYGVESYERENAIWLKSLIAEHDQKIAEILRTGSKKIKKMMYRRVEPWMTHYIQYTTTPEIDAVYEKQGIMLARMMLGSDSFPPQAIFGGQEFRLYCAAVAIFAGWSRKHIDFCFELLTKHPNLDPHNILTITVPLENEINWLSIALGIDVITAQQVVEAVTLTRENKKTHCSIAGNFITPVFVEIGRNKLLRPLWGSLSEPYMFLLRELRRRYRSDWDNAVNAREQVFRDDLYTLFQSDRFHKLRRNAVLKSDGVVITDVDALIFDRQTGEMGIFQLKWQDFIGNSMRERESKKKNLLHTGNQWIERVSTWLSNVDLKILAQIFDLSGDDIVKIKSFRMFLLGRNSAFFSGDWTPDTRAAWGIWPQFLRLLDNLPNYENPIESLFLALQKDSPLKKPSPEFDPHEMEIGNITIIIGP